MFFSGFSVVMLPVFGATFIFVPCNTLIFSFHSIVYGLVSFAAFTTKYFLWGGALLLENTPHPHKI